MAVHPLTCNLLTVFRAVLLSGALAMLLGVFPWVCALAQGNSGIGIDAGALFWTTWPVERDHDYTELSSPLGPGFIMGLAYLEAPSRRAGLIVGGCYARYVYEAHEHASGLGSGEDTYKMVGLHEIHARLGLNKRVSERPLVHLRTSLELGCWARSISSGRTTSWAQVAPPDTVPFERSTSFEKRVEEQFWAGLQFELGLCWSLPLSAQHFVTCEIVGDIGARVGVGLRVGYLFGFPSGTIGDAFRKDRAARSGLPTPP